VGKDYRVFYRPQTVEEYPEEGVRKTIMGAVLSRREGQDENSNSCRIVEEGIQGRNVWLNGQIETFGQYFLMQDNVRRRSGER